MLIRVVACQQPLHQPLSDEVIARIREFNPDFVGLPEHYPLALEIQNLAQAAALYDQRKSYLADLSRKLNTVLVGGTLTEQTENGYYNTCYVFNKGKEAGFYRKVNPTSGEEARGVLPGSEFKVFEVSGFRTGVLICADVLNTRSFDELASLQCRITFVPTASPFRPNEPVKAKYERDQSIFLEGARRLGCPVIKVCGVGTTFGHPIQGRSLIATPQEIVARIPPDSEHEPALLFAELEI